MANLTYSKHERISLKNHPDFDENWLQERIAEDPGILGLGDVVLIDRERAQERAGRLDLLLADPDENRRYEVELMLGATDESHIIRCIEYWDIERRRYPGYEHCAVLVAEDITSRFLNVVALLAGTVPLVAIQLNALSVGGALVLNFVHVLDQRLLRRDDVVDDKAPSVDRAYWETQSSPAIVGIADDVLTIINQTAEPKQKLNYKKHFIGLSDGRRSRNFIYFRPRKKYLRVVVPEGWTDARGEKLATAGLDCKQRGNDLILELAEGEVKKLADSLGVVIGEIVAGQAA